MVADEKKSPGWLRSALATLAVFLIVAGAAGFLALGGGDALTRLLGSDLFQTVAEEPAADEAAAPVTVTVDDVRAALAGFEGDLAVPTDAEGITCVVDGSGIWVEFPEEGDVPRTVERAALRASALARWVAAEDAGITQVTWIAEDLSQTALLALSIAPASTLGAEADMSAVLSAAIGYRLSGDAFAELTKSGSAQGLAQEAGEAPALPDGQEVPVAAERTEEAPSPSAGVAADSASASRGNAAAGGSGGASGAASSDGDAASPSESASSGSGASSAAPVLITVSITVDGSAAGAGSSSATVSVPAGSSVYDALVKTGISISAQQSPYGVYIAAIGGLAEREHGSMSGWVYSVNRTEPGVACSAYALNAGDRIVWTYVNVES